MAKLQHILPTDEWWNLRALVFVTGALLVLLAAGGVFETALFSQPSTLKYVVTVAGSALVVLLATMQAPLRFLTGIAILVAPFDFVTTFKGVEVTPLLAVDLLAVLVALPRRSAGNSWLRPASAAFVLLLIPAIVNSSSVGHWALWLALTALTGWVAYLVACEPGGARFVASMLALSAMIQGALAIWEFRTGHRLNLYQAGGSSATARDYFFNFGSVTRSSGALPDPIGLGQVLALCLPVTVALAASMRRWSASIATLCIAGVSALGLVLSLSRMSIVGGAVGLGVALVLLPGRPRLRSIAGVGAMLVVVVMIGLAFGGHQLRSRVDSIFHPTAAHVSTASGDVARVRIWNAAVKTGESHLVTGVGFGNITNYLPRYGAAVTGAAHAHDTYLQFLAEGGAIGLIALVVTILAAGRDLVHAFSRQRIWVAGAAGGLVATLIAWSTDVAVRYVQVSAMVAVLIGLIAALSARSQTRPQLPRLK